MDYNKITLPEFKANIHNRFDIEVIDAQTGKIKQQAIGYNVVCDQLWTRLLAPNSYFNYIHYGSGSGTPSTTDTTLFSYVGNGTPTVHTRSLDLKTGVFQLRKYIQLTAATAVGSTISEVGIAHSASTNSLCTHAMLKDMSGNLVSIQKTDTDIINIYATVYVHFNPLGYDHGTITLNKFKNNFTFWNWLAGEGKFSWVGFAGYGVRNGNGTVFSPEGIRKSITPTYNLANRKVTLKMDRLEASEANFGGINYLLFGYNRGNDYGGSGYPMIDLRAGGDWFPYSNIQGENIGIGDGTTQDFALDFPFAHDAKIYIDGNETLDFTLSYGPINTPYSAWATLPLRPDSTVEHHIHAYDTEGIYYNRAYEIGVTRVKVSDSNFIYASNNLIDWEPVTEAGTSHGWRNIPISYQHFKYWKGDINDSGLFEFPSTYIGKNLHFNTAPPEGAVITADYKCDVIAKNANNVFDVTLEIQLGEYTEET